MQMTSQPAHIALRSLLVLESELHGVEILALFMDPLLGSLVPQHGQVLEHQHDDIIHMRQTLLSQVNIDHKEAKALAATPLTANQSVDPASVLQLRQETAGTLVTNEVTQVGAGRGLVLRGEVGDAPGDVEGPDVLDGDHVGDGATLVRREWWLRPLRH